MSLGGTPPCPALGAEALSNDLGDTQALFSNLIPPGDSGFAEVCDWDIGMGQTTGVIGNATLSACVGMSTRL